MSSSTLYRLFDSSGHLLYVGVTNHNMRRIYEHSMEQRWWTMVASATFEHFPDKPAAVAREAQVIEQEAPRYNKMPFTIVDDPRNPLRPEIVCVHRLAKPSGCDSRG